MDTRLNGSQAATLVGVSRQLIYAWTRRGWLARGGDGLFAEADVYDADVRARTSAHSSRNRDVLAWRAATRSAA
jgi:hypothetical protein